jgi:hypothetical protein
MSNAVLLWGLAAFLAFAALLWFLVWLDLEPTKTSRDCVRSHSETRWRWVGKMYLPHTVTVCDEYGPEYPNPDHIEWRKRQEAKRVKEQQQAATTATASDFLHCSRCDAEAQPGDEPTADGRYLCDVCAETMIVREGVVVSLRTPCAECGDVHEVERGTAAYVCDECKDEIAAEEAAAARAARVAATPSSSIPSGEVLRAPLWPAMFFFGLIGSGMLLGYVVLGTDDDTASAAAAPAAPRFSDCNIVTRSGGEFHWPRRDDGFCYEVDARAGLQR